MVGGLADRDRIFATEDDLVAMALALGAAQAGGALSAAETALAKTAEARPVSPHRIADLKDRILAGEDPLGDAFSVLRSPEVRRDQGATYTPAPIVQTMIDWAAATRTPARVIDPGVGSARFLCRAGQAFPEAELVGIDVDPLAALMARANLAVTGQGGRARILLGDYRRFTGQVAGSSLYIGNPPYVRHHKIGAVWKTWLTAEAAKLDLPASRLAGLHAYFFLATARSAKPGDFGAFITASEWLDVNYGALVRALMLGRLGGRSVTVIDPTAQPFPDAAATAAIATFDIGAKPRAVSFRRIEDLASLGELGKGRTVPRERLAAEGRWSHLTRDSEKPPEGYVELGELCRVHRGTVTGANGVWIAGAHSVGLPETVLFPTITRAREVLEAGGLLADSRKLRRVIDLPADLDELDSAERKAVTKFLKVARAMGANKGYVASHRKAWWSVGLRAAAPIISTYMARRPPGFIINQVDARHINIAHGLYPRDPMSDTVRKSLVSYLQSNISQRSGRTYAGGLTKFEPREMERLIVPGPALLAAGAVC
ncbi:N-6 DNA methylase [Salipiger sp. P9]|uniref:Eco57I restriction-modification methylase domain-containing protein n=1 Tax=Salipiger pentaromativorans TaxID=2943193 RepID=UPI002157F513|nr:N-6 DNA methylase [Salipiger pentaromativorans]MCR8548664.1 N-6 DNA methylase [Salipiger pentaromativorans]